MVIRLRASGPWAQRDHAVMTDWIAPEYLLLNRPLFHLCLSPG